MSPAGGGPVAIAVADAVSAAYRDGVWFVGLASLADPELVPSALGTVLGISLSGINQMSGLTAWLRDKHALTAAALRLRANGRDMPRRAYETCACASSRR